jgi:hypothetical protein
VSTCSCRRKTWHVNKLRERERERERRERSRRWGPGRLRTFSKPTYHIGVFVRRKGLDCAILTGSYDVYGYSKGVLRRSISSRKHGVIVTPSGSMHFHIGETDGVCLFGVKGVLLLVILKMKVEIEHGELKIVTCAILHLPHTYIHY